MISDPIYKRDSKGRLRSWQYEVDGFNWRTISGLVDGQKVTTWWTVSDPRSRPTAEEQALFEAQAEEKKKLDRDYRRAIAELDTPIFKPMLAHKYEGWVGPCWSQPKLDGIRCIARADGLWSRQGKPIVACPHIVEALAWEFKKYPELVFDGELYNHDLRDDFNQITSAVKKLKPSVEDVAESARLIQYHVYDLPVIGEKPFEHRADVLGQIADRLNDGRIKFVEPYYSSTLETLDELYVEYLEDGYEGQMVRLDGPYEQKRSKMLLKRKEFQDREFPVVRIEEGNGNWAGYAKRAVLRLDDGREFGAGIKGDQAFTRRLLSESPVEATVRFFALTPDGVPRFPVAVAFHGAEGRL